MSATNTNYMAKRHTATRRLLLERLYALDVLATTPQEADIQSRGASEDLEELGEKAFESVLDGLSELLHNLWDDRVPIDAEISKISPRWRIDRMATLDRNVLRLGIWALQRDPGAAIVILNDCIELAKRYGDKGSSAFVNGLLDQFCQNHGISLKRSKRQK